MVSPLPPSQLMLSGSGQDSDGVTLQSPSNVCLLARAIEPIAKNANVVIEGEIFSDVIQIVYYQAGVGTGFGLVNRLWGDATGLGVRQNICEAYGFVAHNWQPGDEIYLLGFSRGAFTAR